MDMGGFEKGYLVANSFSAGAECAIEFINDKYSVKIKATRIANLPIGQYPTEQERAEYY